MKNYKDLDIYQISYKLAIEVHKMTLKLPKYELYEIGSQVRRSSQSIKDNIVEGYGRKDHKNDLIRFLNFAYASCLETQSQLEMINDLHKPRNCMNIINEYVILGKKISSFIKYVHNSWLPHPTNNQLPTTNNK